MIPSVPTIALVAVALIFDFLNGFHDSGNIVATMISSRAMGPRQALFLAFIANLCGPFLFGVAVATTIGKGVISPEAIALTVIFAALLGAILWNLITWYFGIPSSSSHALIGGMIGAVGVSYGFDMIQIEGLLTVVIALFASPLLGLITGYLFMKAVFFLARGASPRINQFFKRGQIVTSIALALSHGTNDAQKTMGIITMGLVSAGYLAEFAVPPWVVALCAVAIALGTISGGWRIIKTLGIRMYRVRPVHGFAAQACSALVVLGAALLGGPVSTTQVVSSAIMGAGSAERLSKVRWGVAKSIVIAWIITIPASMFIAGALYKLINVVL